MREINRQVRIATYRMCDGAHFVGVNGTVMPSGIVLRWADAKAIVEAVKSRFKESADGLQGACATRL